MAAAKKTRTKAAARVAGDTPFDDFDLQKAKEVITNALPDTFEATEKFYEGDHWQDGEGWMGPTPSGETFEGEQKLVEDVMGNLEERFVSKNVIREMVKRHVRGVAGRDPVWTFDVRRPLPAGQKRTATEDRLISEVADALDIWYKKRRVHLAVKEVASMSCRAGRGLYRLYTPPGLTVTRGTGDEAVTGVPRVRTLAEALEYIYVSTPSPKDATLYTDEESQQQLGVLVYQPIDPSTLKPTAKEVVELTYLDGRRPIIESETNIRRIEGNTDDSVTYSLGGRLPMIEVDRAEPLIDQQIHESQKALNLALSMLPRTMVTAGFLERIFLDAQMPGEWEYDNEGNRKPGTFKPSKHWTGAGTSAYLRGIEYDPKEGEQKIKDPKVVFRDPVDPSGAIKAAQFHYLTLLEMGNQAHIVLTGEAIVSGKSREQARADYDSSLQDTKGPLEEGSAQLLETVLAMAENFMGAPGRYTTTLRAVFRLHVFTGPISWEERKQNDESVKAGTMSTQSAIQQSGNPDADAEIAQIAAERNDNMSYLLNLSDAFQKLSSGMPAELAAEVLGIDPAIVAKMTAALDAEALRDKPPAPTPTPKPKPKKKTGGTSGGA